MHFITLCDVYTVPLCPVCTLCSSRITLDPYKFRTCFFSTAIKRSVCLHSEGNEKEEIAKWTWPSQETDPYSRWRPEFRGPGFSTAELVRTHVKRGESVPQSEH